MKNAQQMLTEIEAYEKVLLNENVELLDAIKAAKAKKTTKQK